MPEDSSNIDPLPHEYDDCDYPEGNTTLGLPPTSPSLAPLSPHSPYGDISASGITPTAISHFENCYQVSDSALRESYQDASLLLSLNHLIPAQRQSSFTSNRRNEIVPDLVHEDNLTSPEGSSLPSPTTNELQQNIGTYHSATHIVQSINSTQESPVQSDSTESIRKQTAPRTRRKNLQLNCGSCVKIFTRRCDLNKHAKTHKRAFKCTVAGCDNTLGFALPKDLRRHIDTIHRKSTFTCDFPNCGQTFSRSDNCQRHVEEKHS